MRNFSHTAAHPPLAAAAIFPPPPAAPPHAQPPPDAPPANHRRAPGGPRPPPPAPPSWLPQRGGGSAGGLPRSPLLLWSILTVFPPTNSVTGLRPNSTNHQTATGKQEHTTRAPGAVGCSQGRVLRGLDLKFFWGKIFFSTRFFNARAAERARCGNCPCLEARCSPTAVSFQWNTRSSRCVWCLV